MTTPSERDDGVLDADDESRLPAVLIWVVAAAIICAAATWPRWHSTPSPNAMANSVLLNNPASENHPTPAGITLAQSGSRSAAATQFAANPSISLAPTVSSGTPSHVLTAGAPRLAENNVQTSVEDWQHLSDKQRLALGPFVDEWAHIPDSQKRKWLAIAAVYPKMSPDAQQRLHARMLRWVQTTPDERTLARENYQMSRVLPPNVRQQAWRAYEALSPAQKAKLAAAERSRRRKLVVSALPGAHMPVTSSRIDKNALQGASGVLSTEKLIPLNAANGAHAGASANDTGGVSTASAGSNASPASNTTSPPVRGAKGAIGNLNVDSDERP